MDVALAMIAATLVALALLWFAARNAVTLVVAEIHQGRLVVTRGGIAPRVLADLADVVAQPRVERGKVRVVRERGRAEIEIEGDLSAAQIQRIRNVIGTVPLAKLANVRRRR